MSKYGENIKKIRSVRGLTQSQLADVIDVSRGVISSYEEGRAEPKIETIIKTAEVFQVTIDTLLKKNITVNQLSGFVLPDILTDHKLRESLNENKEFANFFPNGLIILEASKLNENAYCNSNELIFGVNEDPIKNKLFVIELYYESIIGKITQLTDEFIFFNRTKILLKDIKRYIKVIGIYQPYKAVSPLENRLSTLEKRLKKLEDIIEND
ncbi:helix-turn-helix transcriptional regulator [Marivirga tractuosa]|uniref:helix-turn-helix domain-containing protein n=1 Tax=Marivirga tractuosa TaxID=1006 RepID=UPI0035D098E8